MLDLPEQPDDSGNQVNPEDGCPLCGERRADYLVWRDDDRVECHMCGTIYTPPGTDGPDAPSAL